MAKIEEGMLVEIINVPEYHYLSYLRGHIGIALRHKVIENMSVWVVEGAEQYRDGAPIFIHEQNLRPVRGDNPDIQEAREKGCGDWDLMPWKPEKETIK